MNQTIQRMPVVPMPQLTRDDFTKDEHARLVEIRKAIASYAADLDEWGRDALIRKIRNANTDPDSQSDWGSVAVACVLVAPTGGEALVKLRGTIKQRMKPFRSEAGDIIGPKLRKRAEEVLKKADRIEKLERKSAAEAGVSDFQPSTTSETLRQSGQLWELRASQFEASDGVAPDSLIRALTDGEADQPEGE